MLFKLLGAPFSLPASGLKFVFQQIADVAEAELMQRLREIKALKREQDQEIPPEADVSARRRVVVETPFDEP